MGALALRSQPGKETYKGEKKWAKKYLAILPLPREQGDKEKIVICLHTGYIFLHTLGHTSRYSTCKNICYTSAQPPWQHGQDPCVGITIQVLLSVYVHMYTPSSWAHQPHSPTAVAPVSTGQPRKTLWAWEQEGNQSDVPHALWSFSSAPVPGDPGSRDPLLQIYCTFCFWDAFQPHIPQPQHPLPPTK